MNAKKLKAEIEATLLRNLGILMSASETPALLRAALVSDMLRASAANLAQILSERHGEGCECDPCMEAYTRENGPTDAQLERYNNAENCGGPDQDPSYRERMIAAGRGHLLR